jgi:hypothetical protein
MLASIHATSIDAYARAHTHTYTHTLSLTHTLSHTHAHTHIHTHTHTPTHTQVCDPCFYHGSHTFAYSDDGTKMKNVTLDSLTERTVGQNDLAWGLMDEMVCKYGTWFHECMNALMDIGAVFALHTHTLFMCVSLQTRTLSLSLPLCLSRDHTRSHSLSDARSLVLCLFTRFLARTHTGSSHVCAHTHMQTLSSLLTDPKTKGVLSSPNSPESRALLLKTFGARFTPEECQKKVLSATPRMIRGSFCAWTAD